MQAEQPTVGKPKIITNQFGQKVRVWDWEDFQKAKTARKVYRGDIDLNGKTIVIHHTWGIGDIFYTTPALRGLKEKFPKCKIIFICSHPDVLEGNPYVDSVVNWMQYNDIMSLSDDLRGQEWYWLDYDVPLKGGFDYKIHLRTKPALNEHLLRLLKRPVSELNNDERAFVDQASNSAVSRYRMVALDMYCMHAYVDPPQKTIYYYPKEDELEFARKFYAPIRVAGLRPIILIPYSSSPYKDYPYWKRVVDILPKSYHWVILGASLTPSGKWTGDNVTDCSGAFRIRQSAAMVIEADLCCSSDTGLLYPRAARGGKCIVTYGPHEPEPFLHYFPSAIGLRVPKLERTVGMEGMCSTGCYIDTTSCHKEGQPSPCLVELEPEFVARRVREALGE